MKRVTLDEICDFYNGGAWSDKEYVSSGIPVLKVTNCKPSGFQIEEINYLPIESADKYAKNKLRIGDVIIATVGSHPNLKDSAAGRTCIVNNLVNGYYLNQNAVCLRTKDSNILNQEYLGYLAQYYEFRHYIQMRGRGAANQMRIAISAIKEYKFDLPDIEIQNKISEILSKYDNLIENNQKQIKLLEEIAQRLYKEWFIDLKFPGHEKVNIVNGVPEGWKRVTIDEALEQHLNGGWGKEDIVGKNIYLGKVIRGTDINDIKAGQFTGVPLRYHTDKDIKKKVLKENDIVFELSNGNLNNIGRCLLIDKLVLSNCGKNTICASFCKLLRPVDRKTAILMYWEIQSMQFSGRLLPYKKHGANGINNFDFEGFIKHEFLIPENEEMMILLYDIMGKISNIQMQNSLIREARDHLLQKLMGGEMEV